MLGTVQHCAALDEFRTHRLDDPAHGSTKQCFVIANGHHYWCKLISTLGIAGYTVEELSNLSESLGAVGHKVAHELAARHGRCHWGRLQLGASICVGIIAEGLHPSKPPLVVISATHSELSTSLAIATRK